MRLRNLAVGALPLLLGACGFQPLYGRPDSAGRDVNAELARIYVNRMPDRYGQEMRLALQAALADGSQTKPDGYRLQVGSSASEQAIDIHSDNTSGRTRIEGHAHWELWSVAVQPVRLASGDADTIDGYSPSFEQLFSQTLNDETSQARITQALAQVVRQQLAIWFRAHVEAPETTQVKTPGFVDPTAIPNANGAPVERAGPDGFPASATGRIDQPQTSSSSDDQ